MYVLDNVSGDTSLLEMFDMLNEKLTLEGKASGVNETALRPVAEAISLSVAANMFGGARVYSPCFVSGPPRFRDVARSKRDRGIFQGGARVPGCAP